MNTEENYLMVDLNVLITVVDFSVSLFISVRRLERISHVLPVQEYQ